MALSDVDKIARAVLYEGYMLYPYRPSLKNSQRGTFGTLYPRTYSERHGGADAWIMQTQCLIEGSGDTRLSISSRFLQFVDRTLGKLIEPVDHLPPGALPPFQHVDALLVNHQVIRPWQEAVEKEMPLPAVALSQLKDGRSEHFDFPCGRDIELVRDVAGRGVGVVIRERQALSAAIELAAQLVEPGLWRVTVRVLNAAELAPDRACSRDEALLMSLLSAHVVLTAEQGQFVSLIDPPPPWEQAAAQCCNIGCFPVLAGSDERRDTMLASPIILYDYPQVAPESQGDFFDGCEIDELLTLRLNTLTDSEKAEMSGVDERVRALLQRADGLGPDQMTRLHGQVRDFHVVELPAENLERRPQRAARVGGIELRPGDRVRLRPRRSADAFDVLLSGKIAVIHAIEQDFENQLHLAVTLDDDPGADLGAMGKIGHRFFFFPDEVEPLADSNEDRR